MKQRGLTYFERSGLVWGSKLPPTQRFILLALNDHADQHGSSCYPGQARLAELTGYSRRTVIRALDSLKKKKVVGWEINGHKTKTQATNNYQIDFTVLQGKQRTEALDSGACDTLTQGVVTEDHKPSDPMPPCDTVSPGVVTEDHKGLCQSVTRSTHRSNQEIQEPPLTPHGGECDRPSENSESRTPDPEPPENNQTPLSDQQALQPVEAQKGKGAARRSRKNKTADSIYAAAFGGLKDSEAERARFETFWLWYVGLCRASSAAVGAKTAAAESWRSLLDDNFSGRGYEEFRKGCSLYSKFKTENPVGVPHCCRFLRSKSTQMGGWEEALDLAAARGAGRSDFLQDADQPVRTGIYKEFVPPPPVEAVPMPAHLRKKYNIPARGGAASA